MESAHIYLIPGFFGFANMGQLRYFNHVAEYLTAAMGDRGVAVKIHQVPTLPTSSVTARAVKLLEAIEDTAGDDDLPLHLIGHSTGGLDIRLLLSQGLSLPTGIEHDTYIPRVRSAITVSCPHYGTPLAGLFTSVLGQKLLKLLSATTLQSIRFGFIPAPALVLLAESLFHSSSLVHLRSDILERALNAVLASFEEGRKDQVVEFLSRIEDDQALLLQLSPECMDLFNAHESRQTGIRYGCVVTRSPRPSFKKIMELGIDPRSQAAYAVFKSLHRLSSGMPARYIPALTRDQKDSLRRSFGELPPPESNDAIVPALSQVWCHVVHATWADHLDVIGHFDDPNHEPPHSDWLNISSGFRRADFESLWNDVADFALGS